MKSFNLNNEEVVYKGRCSAVAQHVTEDVTVVGSIPTQ